MMRRLRLTSARSILTACSLAGLLLGVAACGDPIIDPFDNDDHFFSIYGFIDVLAEQHVVRVIAVARTPERIEDPAEAFIDARVTSTDLSTGLSHLWTHSVEQLDDGLYGHIFRATFLVQPQHTYRLQVRRSDGATATAETTVPWLRGTTLFERHPINVSSDSTVVTQDVFIPGISSPGDLEVIYRYQAILVRPFFANVFVRSRVAIPYSRAGERLGDGWQFTITISDDQAFVLDDVRSMLRTEQTIHSVFLTFMGIQMKILDDKWTLPAGTADLEDFAQPGTLSNVKNGYGFWGSIGLYVEEWAVSPQLSQWLRY